MSVFHSTAAKLAADVVEGADTPLKGALLMTGVVYAIGVAVVCPPVRRFLDEVEQVIDDRQRGECMDYMTIVKGQ